MLKFCLLGRTKSVYLRNMSLINLDFFPRKILKYRSVSCFLVFPQYGDLFYTLYPSNRKLPLPCLEFVFLETGTEISCFIFQETHIWKTYTKYLYTRKHAVPTRTVNWYMYYESRQTQWFLVEVSCHQYVTLHTFATCQFRGLRPHAPLT